MALKDLNPELRSKLIERIKALFNLGDKSRNNSEKEAETATLKAQELLKKYNLHVSEILNDDVKTVKDGIVDEIAKEWKRSTLATWEKNLLAIVGECCECRPYIAFEKLGNSKTWKFRFIGTEWDVAIAKELINFLYNTLKKNSVFYYRDSIPNQRSYLEGACHALGKRVNEQTEMFKKQQAENNKYALLVINKKDAINEYVQNNLRLQKATQRRFEKYDHEAYSHGYKDGEQINIGTENVLK